MEEQTRNSSVTVGTAAVLVSPQLLVGQRTALTIVNTSTLAQVITLSWGKEAVAGQGVVLSPYGAWSESIDSSFIPSNQNVWAVSSAAAGSIAVHERVRC